MAFNIYCISRYKNASGDAVLQTNELTELIKNMYQSFTQSQEKLQTKRTTDAQIQCEDLDKENINKTCDLKIVKYVFYIRNNRCE